MGIGLYATSIPVETFVLNNKSEIDIMYSIQFNNSLRKNSVINGIETTWQSPIHRNIIKKDGIAPLFSCKTNEDISVIQKINDIIKELYIYTIDGSLILKLEDINDTIFEHSFPGLSRYAIVITQENIYAGLNKYIDESKVNNEHFLLTYFDNIEFYDYGFSDWFGISTLFYDNSWGIGINSVHIYFIPFKYFQYGLGFFNIDYVHEGNGLLFIHFLVPSIGLHYSFNNKLKVAINGITKLGIEIIDKKCLFSFIPGFSVNFIFDPVGLKYSGLFHGQYGYMHEITISFSQWFQGHRYK